MYKKKISIETIVRKSGYDEWFVREIAELVLTESQIKKQLSLDTYVKAKSEGFSDEKIMELSGVSKNKLNSLKETRKLKTSFRNIDTCSGEFQSFTPYMYSSWSKNQNNAYFEKETEVTNKKKVIIIGGGPNRIGQGIEFDYCCVHSSFAIREMKIESIMINCNPETVSTDFDISDRLYFEPLDFESVIEICKAENQSGRLAGSNSTIRWSDTIKISREVI